MNLKKKSSWGIILKAKFVLLRISMYCYFCSEEPVSANM